jgi:Holliday junction resolvasome RuvABC endonuclease subunit
MITIGVDPSLTSTGVVVLNSDGAVRSKHRIEVVADQPWGKKAPQTVTQRMWRIDAIRKAFSGVLYQIDHTGARYTVAFESYSFGSKGNSGVSLGELGGLLRMEAMNNGAVRLLEVPPTSAMKFVTGSGKMGKGFMMRGVFKRWGFEAETDNEADAFAVAQVACAFMRREIGQPNALTNFQEETLTQLVAQNQSDIRYTPAKKERK